ncbi:hypothetical protein T265_09488 [Opisthorchis viverrini]|uniref:EF-hand domain-containing protein n=1 Tax=Opisthorchis viverrini TaxID=6198 RepID=A0A075A4R5_OPIVI|nr:hypothetical protein T265_09488 [Opisthorchis viverrini]KER22409.1 hypothetical protein T265_09488 [Opisthorchis viverrini]
MLFGTGHRVVITQVSLYGSLPCKLVHVVLTASINPMARPPPYTRVDVKSLLKIFKRYLYFKFVRIYLSSDKDGNGRIDANELQSALSNGVHLPFNINTVSMMMKMFDRDGSGGIEFNEFAALYDYVYKWKTCFQRYDTDRSGAIDAQEMQVALRSFGYDLSHPFVCQMLRRFDRTTRGCIAFDDFIYACVCLHYLTDAFRPYDHNRNGWAEMNFEQFLMAALSIIV